MEGSLGRAWGRFLGLGFEYVSYKGDFSVLEILWKLGFHVIFEELTLIVHGTTWNQVGSRFGQGDRI